MMTRRYGLLALIIISLLTFGACERINPEPDDTEQNEGNSDDNNSDDTDRGGQDDGNKDENEDGGGNGGSSDGNNDSGEGNEGGNGSEGGDNGDSQGGNEGQGGNGDGGNGDGSQGDDYQWEAGTYFAPGVTKESGWYDVNKKRDGQSDGDFLLCWAASAANLAQWWQDQYKAAGYTLPAGTPDGKGSSYELAIFEKMKEAFGNDGCDINIGVHWYFTGEDRGVNMSGFPHPAQGSGGFFKDSFASIKAELGGDSYCEEIQGYYIWGGGKSDSRNAIEIWSEYVKDNLRKGALGMAIKPGFSSLHAVTLWGCDLDENGNVTAIYITDSDDQMSTPSAPRVQILHHYNIVNHNGKVHISGYFTGGLIEITALTPLKQYPPTE